MLPALQWWPVRQKKRSFYLQLVSSFLRGLPSLSAGLLPAAVWPDEISVRPECSLCHCSAYPAKITNAHTQPRLNRVHTFFFCSAEINRTKQIMTSESNRISSSCISFYLWIYRWFKYQLKPMQMHKADPVLEAGDADREELQQFVELWWRHIHGPALDQAPVGILHHPQETHQQVAACVCSQGGYRLHLLGRTEGITTFLVCSIISAH